MTTQPISGSEQAFLDLVGVEVPIVQAPMAGATTPQLAAAVCAAGGLGGLGLGAVGASDARRQIRTAHALGARPLNVNFFLHEPPRSDGSTEAVAAAERVARALGVSRSASDVSVGAPFDRFGPAMLDMVLEERPSVITFQFGVPDLTTVHALHQHDIVIGVSATTVDEALAVERAATSSSRKERRPGDIAGSSMRKWIAP